MDLASFTDLVESLVRDDDGRLATSEIATAVTLATNRYSKDRPRLLIEDVTASAAQRLNEPASWDSEFSEIRSIEYPLDQSPPCFIPTSDFYVYEGINNVKEIRLVFSTAVVGANCRIRFTAKHESPSTFADDHLELVAGFAAAHLCDHLSAIYGHTTDPTIQSDSVDHNNKGRDFAIRAKSLRSRYEKMFEPRTASSGASAVKVVQQKSSKGARRLFH